MKRIIVCGDRFHAYYKLVERALRAESDEIELLIEGEATGADSHAKNAGMLLRIPLCRMPAKWKEHGLAAGPIRNQAQLDKLLEYPSEKEVWAFHTRFAESRGTRDMVKRARQADVPVRLYASTDLVWNYVA